MRPEGREYYDREPDHIHFGWRSRDCCNKCARFTYVAFKTLFVCAWYYFVPFVCLYASFAIPFIWVKGPAAEHAVDPLTAATVSDDTSLLATGAGGDDGFLQ